MKTTTFIVPAAAVALVCAGSPVAGASISEPPGTLLSIADVPASLDLVNIAGLVIMALVVTALAFVLWFAAVQGAGGPAAVAPMMLLTPITAFALDALFRGFVPSPLQSLGVVVVIVSLLYGQHVDRRAFRVARHHAPSARQLAKGIPAE